MNIADTAREIAKDRPILFRRMLLYPGSFDPPANHHIDIIVKLIELKRSMEQCDPTVPVDVVAWPVGP